MAADRRLGLEDGKTKDHRMLEALMALRLEVAPEIAEELFRRYRAAIADARAQAVEWVVDEGTIRSLERELDTRQARIAALEEALDIETLGRYHATSFADPPSYHEPDVDAWECPRCVERFINRAKAMFEEPPPTHERTP